MRVILAVFCVVLIVGAAMAKPIEWPVSEGGNGHYYEKFDGSEIVSMSWRGAEQFAETLEFNGMTGHLITITTLEEFLYSKTIIDGYPSLLYGTRVGAWNKQAWDPTHEENLGWRMITGESFDQDLIPNQYIPLSDNTGGVLGYSCGHPGRDECCDWESEDPDDPIGGGCIIVEFDNFPVIDPLPENLLPTHQRSWGALKTYYR